MRKRLLPFEAVVLFLIQKTTSSLSVSLTDFFADSKRLPPSKSAFSQARVKLCYKVFKRLNLLICRLFYTQGGVDKWNNFRVLSIDGSTIALPNHPSLGEKFTEHCFGVNKSVKKWMSRVSFLYDVLNNILIDAQMESFTTSEASLCKAHLGFLRKGDLVLFDRYYASHYLFSVLLHKQIHFVFRMNHHSWKCVKAFMASDLQEQIVEIQPYPYSKVARQIPDNVCSKVQIRLVKHISKSGRVSCYATSLVDTQQFTVQDITQLYTKRWGVEEAFKTLKARLDVVHFSGKTVQAVQQDFYAKVFLISLTAILKSNIKPSLKKKKNTQNTEQRKPIINNTFAMAQTKNLIRKVYFSFKKIAEEILYYLTLVKNAVEYSRKGLKARRKKDKGRRKTFNQNYKPI